MSSEPTQALQAPEDVAGRAAMVEGLFREIEARIQALRPREDLAQVEKAYRFAVECHRARCAPPASPTWSIP